VEEVGNFGELAGLSSQVKEQVPFQQLIVESLQLRLKPFIGAAVVQIAFKVIADLRVVFPVLNGNEQQEPVIRF